MYNTDYICRYNKDDVFLETDDVNNQEKEYIRDLLYKEDLINIFSLNENDDFDCLNNILIELYNKIKNNEELNTCMIYASSKLLSEDKLTGLCILYSYDFMYLTHECVSEYLIFNSITENKIKKLKHCINN